MKKSLQTLEAILEAAYGKWTWILVWTLVYSLFLLLQILLKFWETIRTQKLGVSSLAYTWGSFSFIFSTFCFFEKMNFTENESLRNILFYFEKWNTFLALLMHLFYYNQYNATWWSFISVNSVKPWTFPPSGSMFSSLTDSTETVWWSPSHLRQIGWRTFMCTQ